MKMNMGHWCNYIDGKTEFLGGKPAPVHLDHHISHVDRWVTGANLYLRRTLVLPCWLSFYHSPYSHSSAVSAV